MKKQKFNEYYKELISEARFTGLATGITSKMWIMPNGKVLSTDGLWHYQWAEKNRKILQNNYGISFQGSDENSIRIELIKQGMFRLNHEARGNRVTIEGLKKYFSRRVKDAILGLVMDHSGDFAYLNITLFDEDVSKIVYRKSANLFGMREKDKVNAIDGLLKESIKDIIINKNK